MRHSLTAAQLQECQSHWAVLQSLGKYPAEAGRPAREGFPVGTQRTSPCISSRPPSIHRFLNVSCDRRQLKALAVPPIRNQMPLQPGTSTAAGEKGFVHSSYCVPSAQPCTVTGVASGRCRTGPERSCLPQLGSSLAPPCQPAQESTKTQINFKQVRRIPRRVMRKDRNTHAHTSPA